MDLNIAVAMTDYHDLMPMSQYDDIEIDLFEDFALDSSVMGSSSLPNETEENLTEKCLMQNVKYSVVVNSDCIPISNLDALDKSVHCIPFEKNVDLLFSNLQEHADLQDLHEDPIIEEQGLFFSRAENVSTDSEILKNGGLKNIEQSIASSNTHKRKCSVDKNKKSRKRQNRDKKLKAYMINEPYNDDISEKKRQNAIKAFKNRVQKKEKMIELEEENKNLRETLKNKDIMLQKKDELISSLMKTKEDDKISLLNIQSYVSKILSHI